MRSRPSVLRLAFAGLVLGALAYALRLTGRPALGAVGPTVDDALYTGIEVLATALVAVRVAVVPRARATWAALALCLALWTVGDLGWTLHYDDVAAPPLPNWTDAAYLVSYPFAYVALILLLRTHARSARASVWLDGLVGGLALGALCAAAFFGPIVDTAGTGTGGAITLAYPVLDVLLLCFVGLAFGLRDWRPGGAWVLLGIGLGIVAFGDAAYSYLLAVGSYSGSSWVNGTWPAGMAVLAAAAWQPSTRRTADADADCEAASGFIVPGAFALAALGLLAWSQFRPVPLAAALLAVGALAAAGARALLTHRENVVLLRGSRVEAMTDGLTGLRNRRRLLRDLEATLADGGAATLVLFDLDGFKRYNDTFGHVAGDSLLVRLAEALDTAVGGDGAAYRLGGDEFCVLLDHDADRETAAVVRAGAALTDEGGGFTIDSSFGVVRLPGDASTVGAALQLADDRMYDDKDHRHGSPRRQARDLLLQVLKEREPELEEHVDDVGALALAVGRQLGLDAEALDEVARGAELHDVGKVAVPEAILHKPGPLDDLEWQIMRQHTIVGERILAAAPALRPVAKLVRASHEHWDGRGYPDGLAGEAIPLGARIIAVCDAFDAMRQKRPYAPSLAEPAALAELRRCAGTQFDPRVVEAFARVLAQGAGEALRVA
jgi:diguanylate cyclase (GGDEF)-like protein